MTPERARQIISRVGQLAILYYPTISAHDPGYSLSADVAWALEDAGDHAHDGALRDLVARVIIDPTGSRDALAAFLYAHPAPTR